MKVGNEMTKQRHIHADFIIMQANDMSLRFDYYSDRDECWKPVVGICPFYTTDKYRLHEREFPKTSLDHVTLSYLWNENRFKHGSATSLLNVANAAIKQYILDTEKESK